jgi:RNA 2',3'-cyclic 3'-phosphodiesterase
MIRLFVALNIPQKIKEEIIQLRNSIIINPLDYKWEAPDKLHLTLKFIGEVEDNLVEKIQNEISFINEYKAFNCTFSKFGFFYSGKEPKILWLGLYINEEIFNLVIRLNEELVKFGMEKEKKKFKPHLTLIRVRKKLDKNFINSCENCKLPDTEFLADSISLIKSELQSSGSRYTEIKNYKLQSMGGK